MVALAIVPLDSEAVRGPFHTLSEHLFIAAALPHSSLPFAPILPSRAMDLW